jgi:hypothetical protein
MLNRSVDIRGDAMRPGRFRFTLRQMMVAVAVISLVFAYGARYYVCNSIANNHLRAWEALLRKFPFARNDVQNEMETYYESNYLRYKEAAIYPWVRVQHRFVPFDDARRSEIAR